MNDPDETVESEKSRAQKLAHALVEEVCNMKWQSGRFL